MRIFAKYAKYAASLRSHYRYKPVSLNVSCLFNVLLCMAYGVSWRR